MIRNSIIEIEKMEKIDRNVKGKGKLNMLLIRNVIVWNMGGKERRGKRWWGKKERGKEEKV